MFLHGRKYQKEKKQMLYPEMQKMWPKSLPRKVDQLGKRFYTIALNQNFYRMGLLIGNYMI